MCSCSCGVCLLCRCHASGVCCCTSAPPESSSTFRPNPINVHQQGQQHRLQHNTARDSKGSRVDDRLSTSAMACTTYSSTVAACQEDPADTLPRLLSQILQNWHTPIPTADRSLKRLLQQPACYRHQLTTSPPEPPSVLQPSTLSVLQPSSVLSCSPANTYPAALNTLCPAAFISPVLQP
jgi:hypothetical protein